MIATPALRIIAWPPRSTSPSTSLPSASGKHIRASAVMGLPPIA